MQRSPAAPHGFRTYTGTITDWVAPLAFALILGLWLLTRIESTFAPASPLENASAHERTAGAMLSLADGRCHVEAIADREGRLRIFTFNHTGSEVLSVEVQTPLAYVAAGDQAAVQVELSAEPQAGDLRGFTSQFVGRLPADLLDRPLQVTVPLFQIDGQRYRLGFEWSNPSHLPQMPTKVLNEAEQQLYFTPAGAYTTADIAANGNQPPSRRFAGFEPRHDANPQPGDRVCPITRTKANPQCAWTVGGQRYEFCCPPCIDEFVRLAKESPDQILRPEDY